MTNDHLPAIHFVNLSGKKQISCPEDDNENDNDEELKHTPSDVLAILGFDPLQEELIRKFLPKHPDKASSEKEAQVYPKRNMFHASPKKNRENIKKNGIKTNTGGTTFLNRTYSPRIYLTTRKDAADDFTMSVNGHRCRDAVMYDVYEIDPSKMPSNTVYYEDHKYSDYGIWTSTPIPKTAIVRIHEVDHDWEPDDDYYDGKDADHKHPDKASLEDIAAKFSSLSPDKQEEYLKQHPRSKYRGDGIIEHGYPVKNKYHLDSLNTYIKESKDINKYLHKKHVTPYNPWGRSENEEDEDHDTNSRAITNAITRTKAPKDFTVYSGLGGNPNTEKSGLKDHYTDMEGIHATQPAFLSTSLDYNTADNYAPDTSEEGSDNPVHHILKIPIKKGSRHGAYIGHIRKQWKGEREFLINKGTHFKVNPVPETHTVVHPTTGKKTIHHVWTAEPESYHKDKDTLAKEKLEGRKDKASLEDIAAVLPSLSKVHTLTPKLIQAAQKVYDNWQQDEEGHDEELGCGGICHLIADEFVDILNDAKVLASSVSSNYEVHVYTVFRCKEGIYELDIPYRTYERGGGYTWKKIPDVKFEAHDLHFSQLDHDSSVKSFRQYTDEGSLIDVAATPVKQYEFYKFAGGRGVALTIKKRGKTIQHALKTNDIFAVKPSVKGPDWVALITKELGDGYVFAIPQNTLQRILNNSKKWSPAQPKDSNPSPMHLIQMAQAIKDAKPEGFGSNKEAAPWYYLAKFCNTHIGVKVNPAELLLASEYNEDGLDEAKKGLMKHLKPYILQINKGLMATKKLFNARLTKAQVIALAAYIKNPIKTPSTEVSGMIASHDRKWKVEGNVYRTRKATK